MRDLRDLRDTWERFGRDDPLWAVLTRPGMRRGRWDPVEFLATGEAEISGVLEALRNSNADPPRGLALDFGCGAGRLTRALSSRFDTVVGIDVAETMLQVARQLNPDLVNVIWMHNNRTDLAAFTDRSIDFIYCRLVFQHMPSDLSIGYIREFARGPDSGWRRGLPGACGASHATSLAPRSQPGARASVAWAADGNVRRSANGGRRGSCRWWCDPRRRIPRHDLRWLAGEHVRRTPI
jgi:SAM-dependent methyltransferase